MDLKGSSLNLSKKEKRSRILKSKESDLKKFICEVKIPYVQQEDDLSQPVKKFLRPVRLKSESKQISERQIRNKFRVSMTPESVKTYKIPEAFNSPSIIKLQFRHNITNPAEFKFNPKRSSSTINTRNTENKQYFVPGKYKKVVVLLNNLLS